MTAAWASLISLTFSRYVRGRDSMSSASPSVTEETERTQEASEVQVSVQFEAADNWRWNATGFLIGMPVADLDTTSM